MDIEKIEAENITGNTLELIFSHGKRETTQGRKIERNRRTQKKTHRRLLRLYQQYSKIQRFLNRSLKGTPPF